jgi:TP901 family phage tail tape measure protein
LAESDISVDISTNADQIKDKIDDLTKSVDKLDAKNKKSVTNISSNKKRIDAINKEISADKKLTTSRQKKIAGLKNERLALQRSSGGLQAQINLREKSVAALKKEISSVTQYGAALNTISQPSLRYAMYDLSNNLRRVAVATAALAVAPIGVAIAYDREFANVIRTNELAGESSEKARDALLGTLRDIAQSTPISWDEITDIATLAGQLGIAQDLIGDFTENVAKFSATTDLTVDAASTAFGRLNQLIDGVDGKFEQLGSAILAVGVDSVATESQIVNVATNIASMGNLAQLSAADIIGLSGSLASLGIRPELARGNITRFFSRIGQAVSEGGFKLEEFSRLSGRSAEQFTSEWGTSQSIEVVLDFFDGLSQEAGEAERTLRDLGVTSVRDIPALLRLAQNSDEVRRLVELSNEEFIKGQKIQEQYAIIAGTTAEELRRLGQNFQTLLAVVGEGSVPGLGGFFASISNVIAGITDLLSSPVGQFFSGLAITVALAVAAMATVGALTGSIVAGFSALVFVSRSLGVDLSLVGLKALFSAKGLQSMGLGALTANKSFVTLINTIRIGTLAFGILGIALAAVGFLLSQYNGRIQETKRITDSLLSDQKALQKAFDADAIAVKGGAEALRLISKEREKNSDSIKELTSVIGDEERARVLVAKAFDATAEAREAEEKATERQEGAAKAYLGVLDDSNASGSSAGEVLKSQANAANEAADAYLILGDNVATYLRQQAAQSPEIVDALQLPGLLDGITGEFGSFESLTDQIIGDPEDAQARIDEIFESILRQNEMGGLFGGRGFFESFEFLGQVDAAKQALEAYVESANPETLRLLTEANNALNGTLDELAEKAAIADGEITQLMEDLFGAENAARDVRESVASFFDELEQGADSADITSKSFQDMIASIAGNEFVSVQERVASLNVVLAELEAKGQGTSAQADALRATMVQLLIASGALGVGIAALPEKFASTNTRLAEMLGLMGPIVDIMALVGIEVADVGTASSGAAERVKTLNEQFDELVDSMFEATNLGRETEEAIFSLGQAFGETGDKALYASSEMQDAIGSILAQSGSAEEGVANLAALFAGLADTVGGQSAPALQILRQAISQVAAEFGITEAAAQSFIDTAGGGIANINFDNFNRGIRAVKQEVRTLLDFADDLESVFSRAFDLRFATTFSIDNIADAWQNLSETVEDARYEVDELLASQQDLSADRALKEYFLSVAEAYDDTLRAAQLRKELSEMDRDQAKAARELAEAEQISGGVLTGDGAGARANRGALLGLVEEYQDYIATLAESGASQDELREATEKARRQFTEQARELGFQEHVVQQYAAAFDDVRFAIDNVPRNITVEANVNPALQALNELNASLQTQIRAANDLNRALNQPVSQPATRTGSPATAPSGPAYTQPGFRPTPLRPGGSRTPVGDILFGRNARVTITGSSPRFAIPTGPSSPYSFSSGGFTGRGGMMQPAGVVHKGEYVVPQKYVNQSTGLPDANFLSQLQNGMRSFAMGGFVGGQSGGNDGGTMMVELSPFDRKLLSDAGNVQLRLNGKIVAEATNSNNLNDARRGSN